MESITSEGGGIVFENQDLKGKIVFLKMTSLENKQVLVAKSYNL